MSKIKIGNRNPMFGRKNPNASKWNSENKSIKILVTMLNKDKKTFDKIQELGLYLNKSKQLAQKLCDPRYSHLLCKYGIESIDKL
jgi:hypothetical protein